MSRSFPIMELKCNSGIFIFIIFFLKGQGNGSQAQRLLLHKIQRNPTLSIWIFIWNWDKQIEVVDLFIILWSSDKQTFSHGKRVYWCTFTNASILHTVQETPHLHPGQWWIQVTSTCFYTNYPASTVLKNKTQTNQKLPPLLFFKNMQKPVEGC